MVNPTNTFKDVMTRAARTELPATERFSESILLRRACVSVGVSAWVSVVMDVASIIASRCPTAKLHLRNAPADPNMLR